jgi:hypothetical protein
VNASVKLEVVENTLQCGDTPLYTRTVTDPAVLILLDLSESMDDTIDLLGEDDLNARTPDLRYVVQENVFATAGRPGNAMAFILEKLAEPACAGRALSTATTLRCAAACRIQRGVPAPGDRRPHQAVQRRHRFA